MPQTTDIDLLSAWAFDIAGPVSPAIVAEYRRYLLEYSRGAGPLPLATTFALRRFSADRTARWSPSTLQIVRRAFRSFYRWAAEQGVCENVALALPPIKAPEVPVRVATADTRAKLTGVCHTARDRALVHVIFGSGARRCEVAALRVPDVDIAAGTISIVKSKTGKPRVAPLGRRGSCRACNLARGAWRPGYRRAIGQRAPGHRSPDTV